MHGFAMSVAMFDEQRQIFLARKTAPKSDDLAVIRAHGKALIARWSDFDDLIANLPLERAGFAKGYTGLESGHADKEIGINIDVALNRFRPSFALNQLLNSAGLPNFLFLQRSTCLAVAGTGH